MNSNRTTTQTFDEPLNRSLLARIFATMLLAASIFALSARAQDQPYTGQWLIERADAGSVHFQLRYERHNSFWNTSSWSTDTAMPSLQGLNAADLSSSTGATVHFKLVRDAGGFDCEGWAHNGNASGHWTFVANPTYAAQLKQRGLSAPSSDEQFDLAMSDVSLAFVDELKADGYSLNLADLIRAGKHGVSIEYVHGMKQAGYRFDDLDALTRMRDHGVTPRYVTEMASFGYKNLSAEDLRRLRDHGVNGEYLHSMEQAGFKGLGSEEAIHLRDHGVTPDFIAAMSQAGYKGMSAAELTKMRDHGISRDYIHDLAQVGFQNIEAPELVRMKDHGVNADYIRDLRSAGVTSVDVGELVRMRDVGVTASFVREVHEHGYKTTDPDELIRLRTRGFEARGGSLF